MLLSKHDLIRFWDKVNLSNKCWEWKGSLSQSGYGQFSIKHHLYRASRVSWIIHFGSIPENMCVCHTCDNRKCVNPSHLWLGSHQENMADMKQKGRINREIHKEALRGEKAPAAKLTWDQVLQIRNLYSDGLYSQRDLALRFNISQTNVRRIISKKTWREPHDFKEPL